MFLLMTGLPDFAVGVTMKGKVTATDFERVLQPAVRRVADDWKGINLLLVQETGFRNFTAAAWLKILSINLAFFLKWNKIGMVTEEKLEEYTFGMVGLVIPGQVKMFNFRELSEAIFWISEPGEVMWTREGAGGI